MNEVKNKKKFLCLRKLKLIIYIGFEKKLIILKKEKKKKICKKKMSFCLRGIYLSKGEMFERKFRQNRRLMKKLEWKKDRN